MSHLCPTWFQLSFIFLTFLQMFYTLNIRLKRLIKLELSFSLRERLKMRKETVRGSVDNTLVRLYYLAMIDYPSNWLEKNFQSIISQMKNIKNIDDCYSIFFPHLAMNLKDKNRSVEDYLNRLPTMSYPDVEGEKFSLLKVVNLINDFWQKLQEKIKKKDKKVIETLIKNKIIDNENSIPFSSVKYALFHKIFTFKLVPIQNLKGTNSLLMLYVVYLIETGKIGKLFPEPAEKMKEVALFYACESSKSAVVDLEELWKLINYVMKTKVKTDLNCDF